MRQLVALAVTLEIVVARGCSSLQAEHAADHSPPAIVRIYNYAQVPPFMLREATRGAEEIFEAAGLTSQWRICVIRQNTSSPDDPMCEGMTKANEFSLRISQGPQAGVRLDRSPWVMGYAVIPPERRGVVATVLSERVFALADRSGVDATALMGRVMAHEVGHLLLGTNEHAARGLMRAEWKLNEGAMSEHAEWRFSADEVARIRRAVAAAARN